MLRDNFQDLVLCLPIRGVFLCSRVPLSKGERYDVGTLCLSSRGGHVLAAQMLDVGESSDCAFDVAGDIRIDLQIIVRIDLLELDDGRDEILYWDSKRS